MGQDRILVLVETTVGKGRDDPLFAVMQVRVPLIPINDTFFSENCHSGLVV